MKVVDLSMCGISDDSGMLLGEAIKVNKNMNSLYLRENSLHDYTGIVLVEACRENSNLQKLDIIRNPISFKYQEEIKKCLDVNIELHKKSLVPNYISAMEELKIFEKGKYDDYSRQQVLDKQQREVQKLYDEKKSLFEKESRIEEKKTFEVFSNLEDIKLERKQIEQFMSEEEKRQNIEIKDLEDDIQTMNQNIGNANSDSLKMMQQKKERRDFIAKVTVQNEESVKQANARLSQAINVNWGLEKQIESNLSLIAQQKDKLEELLLKIDKLESYDQTTKTELVLDKLIPQETKQSPKKVVKKNNNNNNSNANTGKKGKSPPKIKK